MVISIIMSQVTKAREVKKVFLTEFSNERITEGGKLGVGTTLFFGLWLSLCIAFFFKVAYTHKTSSQTYCTWCPVIFITFF